MKVILRFIGSLLLHVVSFLALFSFAMFQGGFVSWFLFYSFLPLFIYHLILLFLPLKKWKVTREVNQHLLQAGAGINGKIILERKTRFPVFYAVVEERLPSTLNRKHWKQEHLPHLHKPKQVTIKRIVKEIAPIGFQKRIEIPYTLEDLPRGIHELREIRVVISDVIGFIKKEHTFSVKDELVVHPNVWDIRFVDKAASSSPGQAATHHFPLEQTNTVTGVREYASGDRMSWVDWKQTAKKQTVMTKEFEQEKSAHILLVLDASPSNKRNPYAFEASIELAVSILEKMIKTPRTVDFLTVGSEIRSFDYKETRHARGEIKHHLTKLQPGGETSFSRQLEKLLERSFSSQEMILFTTEIDTSLLKVAKTLRFRRVHVVIFYIQETHLITDQEKNWMEEMKNERVTLHVLTEKDWSKDPLEVSIR